MWGEKQKKKKKLPLPRKERGSGLPVQSATIRTDARENPQVSYLLLPWNQVLANKFRLNNEAIIAFQLLMLHFSALIYVTCIFNCLHCQFFFFLYPILSFGRGEL